MLTIVVITGCIVASIWAWTESAQAVWSEWSLRPYRIKHYQEWYRVLTSVFFHGDWMHLGFNLLAFYSFGRRMEGLYGEGLYLALLLVGAAGSALVTYLKYEDNPYYSSIGLSGVVYAVLFAFLLHNPKAMMLVFRLIQMPAWLLALLYLAYSFYEASQGKGYINHWAHIGGAAAGIFFAAIV